MLDTKSLKDSFVTLTDLRQGFKLKPKQIEQLGAPDKLKRNPRGGSSPQIKLYDRERVREFLRKTDCFHLDAQFDDFLTSKIEKEADLLASAEKEDKERLERNRQLDQQCWCDWRSHYTSDELAKASALYYLNRAAKVYPGIKEDVYELKDLWIKSHQHCLTLGKMVREEENLDYGIKSRILWVHHFEVHGKPFCFHSYARPSVLSPGTGEDKPFYGTLFTREEETTLPMPILKILRALRHSMRCNHPIITHGPPDSECWPS